MIDVNKLLLYTITDQPQMFDAECDVNSFEIIKKLGYDIEIYSILKEVYKESCTIYSFLEECERSKIRYDEVLDYLNIPYGSEWDCVKKLNFELCGFEDFSMNEREYRKAIELMKWVYRGEFDYYEKSFYNNLEQETRKFVIFLSKTEIMSAIKHSNKNYDVINRHLLEYRKAKKQKAINCWNFLLIVGKE